MPLAADAATVKILLDAAQLTVSDDEFLAFARVYPTIRAQADGLYRAGFGAEEPALIFDPTAGL